MTRRARLVSSVVLLALAAIFPAFAQPARGDVMYTVTDLGCLYSGGWSQATGINNFGQVVGGAIGATGAVHAFLYSGGVMQDLGTLGGSTSRAYGINDAGQIVGDAATATGQSHAFLYSNGQMQDLGTLGGDYSIAYGINSPGMVVGFSYLSNGNYHAFLYSGGQMMDLGAGSISEATAINNVGQIVGEFPSGPYGHAFLYSGGVFQDLGTPPGELSSWANGINDTVQVIGGASGHAFLYSGGQMKDLGTLGAMFSEGLGINNAGQVVGYFGNNIDNHAFLFNGISMVDLNSLIDPSSGWTLQEANAINDLGQIVGEGTNSAGQNDAFLLTPTPEPATLTFLALGAIGLFRR